MRSDGVNWRLRSLFSLWVPWRLELELGNRDMDRMGWDRLRGIDTTKALTIKRNSSLAFYRTLSLSPLLV